MKNAAIAKFLNDMADLLELSGDNPFRIRAFRRAADTVAYNAEEMTALTREQRLELPNIGKGVADLIDELEKTGTAGEFRKLTKKYPVGVLEVMRCGGVGPKRAATLYRELG